MASNACGPDGTVSGRVTRLDWKLPSTAATALARDKRAVLLSATTMAMDSPATNPCPDRCTCPACGAGCGWTLSSAAEVRVGTTGAIVAGAAGRGVSVTG